MEKHFLGGFFWAPIPVKRYQNTSGFGADIGKKDLQKAPKAMSIVKEDRQAFGILLGDNIDLNEAFQYPITSVPLSLANPDSTLRQGQKHTLRNHLIEISKSAEATPPSNARWIIDTMALIRTAKTKNTYKDFFEQIIRLSIPKENLCPLSVEFINDIYKQISCKNCTRKERGNEGVRIYLQSVDQVMMTGKDWLMFFGNLENKQNLLNLFATYLQDFVIQNNKLPIWYNKINETFQNVGGLNVKKFDCNHEEADTRMVLHALREDTNVVIISKDTDVLILLVYAYALKNISKKWFMKIDYDKYINIEKIVKTLGLNVAMNIPKIHAITGCDSTSFFYGVGKIKVLKKCIDNPDKLQELASLGIEKTITAKTISSVQRFIQFMCYSGKDDEDLVETRVRLYKKMKVKSSQSLPPDPKSIEQAIKRIHYQLYSWMQVDKNIVTELLLEENGWIVNAEDNSVTPLWFKGMFCSIY